MAGMTLRQFAKRQLIAAKQARADAIAKIKAGDPSGKREFILASIAVQYAKGDPNLSARRGYR